VFSAEFQLAAVCQLAVMFVGNVTVTGYSVTDGVHAKVDGLLAATLDHVVSLLHHACIDPVSCHKIGSFGHC